MPHGVNSPLSNFILQAHDSVLLQMPDQHLHLIPNICTTMEQSYPLTLAGGRKFVVPIEAKAGLNWGDYDEKKNPGGLKEWKTL